MEAIPPLPETFLVRDLEAIKILADERRLQMLTLLRRPTTVKALAQTLELPPSRLYYHINLLLKHGLIRVVDQHTASGIVEKVYQATARRFLVANPLATGDPLPDDTAAAFFGAALDETRREFVRAFLARDPAEGRPPRHPFFSRKLLRLNDAQLSAFHARLDELIQVATAYAEPTDPQQTHEYALTLAFYRHEEEEAP